MRASRGLRLKYEAIDDRFVPWADLARSGEKKTCGGARKLLQVLPSDVSIDAQSSQIIMTFHACSALAWARERARTSDGRRSPRRLLRKPTAPDERAALEVELKLDVSG